ncbi:MAG: hypothetical protein AB8G22_23345 [Saprospiraceae bacterium]
MNSLSETWFIDGNIDFESKKYTLLAYLQRINQAFNERQLYPQLGDLIFHYRNLQQFKESKELIRSQFPKKLTGIQMRKLKVIYEEMIDDSGLMMEIEDIVYYAMQQMQGTVKTGTEFYDFVENRLYVAPIGILPTQTEEGYFFLNSGTTSIQVYSYKMSIFERMNDRFRSLRSQFVAEWTRNFVNTYENIKLELLRVRKSLILPAFYAIETDLNYPLETTLLPVAKRCLVRHLSVDANS